LRPKLRSGIDQSDPIAVTTLMTSRPWPSTAIALVTVGLEMLGNQEEMKNILPDLPHEKEFC
jgi:hypothetical protein